MPVLGILRGVALDRIGGVIDSLSDSGLYAIEITMNTSGAPEIIKEAIKAANGHMAVGAGTVIDKETLKAALDSGATFIVTPVLVEDVVSYCVKKSIPVFPGAFSPYEIYKAWQAGATMVKVFPAGVLGPKYFREIKGPFKDVELLACGGVTPDNLKDYFSNGADAVAFGASVFKREWLETRDFHSISASVRSFVEAYKACQN